MNTALYAPRDPVEGPPAIKQFEPAVQKFVSQLTSKFPPHIAANERADLAQEGRFAVLRALGDYESTKAGRLSTFTLQRIKWGISDALDRLPPEAVDWEEVDTADRLSGEEVGPEQGVTKAEAAGAIRAFVAMLSPQQQDVVIGVFWHGYSQADVARKLGVSRARVNAILREVYERGRAELAQYRP